MELEDMTAGGARAPKAPGNVTVSVVDEGAGEEEEAQDAGVPAVVEGASAAWSKRGLVAVYVGILLMAVTTSLEGQVLYSVVPFTTSSFRSHSLVSLVYVVQGVVNAVIQPPVAKFAQVFGRFAVFTACVGLYVLGYVQMAASADLKAFVAAQAFYAAGSKGLQVLQQILIADTSSMMNRALFSTLPDAPFLATTWLGPLIGNRFIVAGTWRWAYGMWAIILPVVFLPLGLTLFLSGRRAERAAPRPRQRSSAGGRLAAAARVLHVLDLGGIVLLTAALALILIPLTLTRSAPGGWHSPTLIALVTLGAALLVAFFFWEGAGKLAPHPLIPLGLLRSRTFCAGCAVGFFYFMVFYLAVQTYFNSYLLVVQGRSVTAASNIAQTFSFASAVTGFVASLLIKYTRRYKHIVTSGAVVYTLGIVLTLRFRTVDSSTGALVGTQIAVGIGGGMLNVASQLGVQAAVTPQQLAAATATFLTIVEMGGAAGAAIAGAVWTQLIPGKLASYLPADVASQARTIFEDVEVASNYTLYPADSPARVAINRSYQETMQMLLTIALIPCLPIGVLAFLMEDRKLDAVEQSVQVEVVVVEDVNANKEPDSRVRDCDSREA
ncbi:siderophore iron transporter mirC [Xylaria palmicola]|nr:siderophore iron transporter mirC [Xylaria palmicola]